MKAIVVRGFITRMWREIEWEEELVETTNLDDSDAIPHYVQAGDGKFYEYYGHVLPEGKKVYVVEYGTI